MSSPIHAMTKAESWTVSLPLVAFRLCWQARCVRMCICTVFFLFPISAHYLKSLQANTKPPQKEKKCTSSFKLLLCNKKKKDEESINDLQLYNTHTHTQNPSKLCSTYSAIVSNTSPIITLKQSQKIQGKLRQNLFLVSGHGAYTAVFHLHKLEYFRWSIRNCYSI